MELGGVVEEHELDALLHGLHDLDVVGGHLLPGSTVYAVDLQGAKADGGAQAVHCHVAAADNADAPSDLDLLAQVDVLEELGGRHDALYAVLALQPEGLGPVGTNGQQYGVVVLQQLLQGDVTSDGDAGVVSNALLPDPVDLLVQLLDGQPVVGDTNAEHAAQHRELLEDLHLVTLDR